METVFASSLSIGQPGLMISTVDYIIAIVLTVIGGALQGTVGFGFGVLTVPILTLVNPELTHLPQMLTSVVATAWVLLRDRSGLDLSGASWVIAGRLPGALIGVWLLSTATQRFLDGAIAAIVMGAVIVIGLGFSIRFTRRNQFLAGLTSGVSGVTSAVGGPPLALLYRSQDQDTMRSTMAGIMLVGLSINITVTALAGQFTRTDFEVTGRLAPALVVGLLVSNRLRGRLGGASVRTGVLVVAGFSALLLLGRAVFG